MTFILVKGGKVARSAVNPDEPARYATRSDAEIAAKHAHTQGWAVQEEDCGELDS